MSLGEDKVRMSKAQTLKCEFKTMCMKDTDQFDDFYLKLNNLVTNIRALREKMEEVYVVMKLLRAVPTRFLQIASAIEQFGNLEEMSVEEVVGSLKGHEERVKRVTETIQGQLLLKEEEWRKKENSEGQLLLTRDEWLRRTSKERGQTNNTRVRGDRSKVRCFNCQAYGHFTSKCRKPRRDREVQKEANLTLIQEDEPALVIAEVGHKKIVSMLLKEDSVVPKLRTSNEERRESQVWYLDNGTDNHITGAREKFKDLDERVTGKVRFGDGSIVNIMGKGKIVFQCKNGVERILTDVYYIHDLCNNIISLGQLSEAENRVILDGEYLWVYEDSGKLLMKVKWTENQLYKISLEESKATYFMSKAEEDT
ncbi:uncharacterized protein LOC141691198 [Apium graveolens]|uniref:uncharacterized protein LOC141691198 n=1 Tax=Apium graveolens TaxID=4045 RepID=UPI003D7B3759